MAHKAHVHKKHHPASHTGHHKHGHLDTHYPGLGVHHAHGMSRKGRDHLGRKKVHKVGVRHSHLHKGTALHAGKNAALKGAHKSKVPRITIHLTKAQKAARRAQAKALGVTMHGRALHHKGRTLNKHFRGQLGVPAQNPLLDVMTLLHDLEISEGFDPGTADESGSALFEELMSLEELTMTQQVQSRHTRGAHNHPLLSVLGVTPGVTTTYHIPAPPALHTPGMHRRP